MYLNSSSKQLSLGGAAQNWMPSHKAGTITGTAKNDIFYAVYGDRMIGGLGDDQYYVWDNGFSITEKAGEGNDTLRFYGWNAVTLSANVENLVLAGNGAKIGVGNDLDNIVMAGTVGAFMTGGKGNDILVGGSGRDLFDVVAGQGSDVVYNFTIGQDALRLDGYSLGGFDGLLSRASQSGADVVLTLSAKETVILRDMSLADLSASDVVLRNDLQSEGTTSNVAPIDWATNTLTGKDTGATSNGWYAITNGWNTGSLKYGADFTESVTFNTKDLSTGTTFKWDFPTKALAPGLAGDVLAYPDLLFGASPFSGGTNPGDKAQVFPVQLSSLRSLTTSFDVAYSGDTRGFNVAYDIWLTNKPGGDASTITNEIMIWLHSGDFEAFGRNLGIYKEGVFLATIYREPGTKYTAIVANQDVASGTIDLLKLFDTLVDMGIVSKTDYLAASQLGAEVVSGSGSLTINDMAYDVQTNNADGTYTQTHVTGTGATTEVIDPVTVFDGTAGADILSGGNAHIADLWGYAGNDMLTAGTGTSTLHGGQGDDTYILHSATDVVMENGGEGRDTVKAGFSHALADHVENLILTGTGSINGTGNALDNQIFGNGGDNRLAGGAGGDWLDGGAGADIYAGGDGVDTVSYQSAAKGVTVDLWMTDDNLWRIAATGDAVGDTFDSIERIVGSEFDDKMLGRNSAADVLIGGAGADNLNGRGGKDILDGGAGRDQLTGGWGNDTFIFSKGGGRDTVVDLHFMGQKDVIQLDKALGLSNFADVLSHLSQHSSSSSSVITFDTGDSLIVYNVRPDQLHAQDFTFF